MNPNPQNIPTDTEAAAVARIAREGDQPFPVDHENVRILVWPRAGKMQSLEPYNAHPRRPRAQVEIDRPDSLVHYVKTYGDERTILAAHLPATGDPKVLAILDYHAPTLLTLDGTYLNAANWGEHRAVLTLTRSPEWQAWTGKAGKPLPQLEFAEFVEEHAADIVVPPDSPAGYPNAAQMLDVALTLQARTEVEFASAQRLSNGQVQLTYNETIAAKAGQQGQTTIPERFAISTAPYDGGPPYLLTARLRFRLARGAVSFSYQLDRPHKVIEHALDATLKQIAEGTGRTVLRGRITIPAPTP
jgi:uncharacterized protein YfdQ (DUF2303 family)